MALDGAPRHPHPSLMGRPSVYSDDIADEVCRRLADGEALAAICRSEHIPSESTVRGWVIDDAGPGFAARYTRARDIGLDRMADELLQIANTPQMGETSTDQEWGTSVKRGDMIEHRRLQVDARKWYLAKMAPKRYGDRVALDSDALTSIAGSLAEARKRAGGDGD